MYEYPFGNGQQLNLDWFLAEWKNLLAAWEAEKNGIAGALDAEIAKAEAALADVFAARDAAAQSAANALESKNAAAQSASDASGYLATVRADANAARDAAQNAAQSESNAADSAQTAVTSKNAAGQSERNAAQSEDNANSSKNAAAQSASDADASKSAAAQSAADADASKRAAAQSADDASDAAASVEASAQQIITNKNDIAELKETTNEIEIEITSSYEQKTITNVPIASFNDGADNVPVKKLIIDIDIVQEGSGDASPDNIRPFNQGWTSAKLTKAGKNIIQSYIVNSDVNIYTNAIFIKTRLIKPNTTYTISFIGTAGNTIYANEKLFTTATAINLTGIRQSITLQTRSIITQSDSGQYNTNFGWIIFKNSKTQQNPNVFNNPQMEFGSVATDYQPIGTTFNIEFPSEAGVVYIGTIDAINGKLTVLYNAVNLGSLDFIRMSNGRFYTVGLRDLIELPPSANSVFEAYSSMYTAGTYQSSWTKNGVMFAQSDNGTVYFRNDAYDNATTFKSEMQGVPLIYKRKTPLEYDLTPVEVNTMLGINNIWADTGKINTLIYRAMNDKSAQSTLIKSIIAPILDNMIADTALVINDFRIVENTLYRVTTPIASGGALIDGTNVTATTVANVLKSILN